MITHTVTKLNLYFLKSNLFVASVEDVKYNS